MSRITRFVTSTGFIAALVLPALSILLPVSATEIENRRLQSPEVTAAGLLDPAFYEEAMVYIRDANPVRAALIRLGASIDLNLFDDSPDPSRVFKGLDDWLYFRSTVTEGCTTPPQVVASNVGRFIRRLEREAGTVVFTIAPSKFEIHPEHLNPSQFLLTECARENSEELQALLDALPLEHYVDGWDLFEAMKDGGVQPYFRTDTHFNYEGAIPWIEALVNEIAPIWDASAVEAQGTTDFQGNLMSFLGLTEPERVRHIVVDRMSPVEPVDIRLNGNLREYEFSDHNLEMIQGEAIILGDSFIDLPETSLVQFFEHATVLDWRDPGAVDYFLTNSRHADVVIVEVSAMDIWRLFADQTLLMRYSDGT